MKYILFILLAVRLCAASYYVDSVVGNDANPGTQAQPWKRHPYMKGFAGKYTHAAGDVFTMKGSWGKDCFPLVIRDSDFKVISDGSGFYVFDAEATEPDGGMVQAQDKGNFSFDGAWITRYGSPNKAEGKKALYFTNGSNITFNACKLTTFSWITMIVVADKAGGGNNITVTNCECSNTTALLWIADSYQTGLPRSGLVMTDNWCHDFASQIGGGVHSDGLLHSFGSSPLTGALIARNRFTGDFRRSFGTDGAMTAFIFCEDLFSGDIIDNVINPTPVQASMADGFIVVHAAKGMTVNLRGNVLVNPGVNSASAGLHVYCPAGGTMDVEKNTVTGLQYAVYVEETGGSYTTDYNTFTSTSGNLVYGPAFQTYKQWQAAGRDIHSTLGGVPPVVVPPVVPPVVTPPANAKITSSVSTISSDGKSITTVITFDKSINP